MKKVGPSIWLLLATSLASGAEPTAAALAAFDSYSRTVESRLARQHGSAEGFLNPVAANDALRRGELVIERISWDKASDKASGAQLYHWRGTAFVPGARASAFEQLLRDFRAYPQHFAPQVLRARLLGEPGDRVQVSMRVRQKRVLTMVMDTDYDVTFLRLDEHHRYSISRSTRIAAIGSPGTDKEHVLSAKDEHGFLWRMNTYWSYAERAGGLYLQIEAVTLTRAIPHGLEWAIRGYVDSIPRESLEFTLHAARNALRNEGTQE